MITQHGEYADSNRFDKLNKTIKKISKLASKRSSNVAENEESKEDFDNLYPKYNCPKCGDWFHLPYKDCECKKSD